MTEPTTLEDVALAAGVSTSTVSRALRGLDSVKPTTQQRIQEIADQLHYVVDPMASRLATGRTMTIALVAPMDGQWFYNSVATGAEAELADNGYDTLRFDMRSLGTRSKFLSQIATRRRVDGLIVVTVPLTTEDEETLARAQVPVVGVETVISDAPAITIDNAAASSIAIEHLISLGHRRIAVISAFGVEEMMSYQHSVIHQRLVGFRSTMEAHGHPVPDEYIAQGAFTYQSGYDAMQVLMKLPQPPTAIMAFSDEMAIGAMKAVRDAGRRVPEDFSIVGFDDHEVAEFVGLTTVRQPVADFGHLAANTVLQILKGSTAGATTLPVEFKIRETTGPPRAQD